MPSHWIECPSQNSARNRIPCLPGMKRCMQTCQIVTGKLTWEWWLPWMTPSERSLLLSRRLTCEHPFLNSTDIFGLKQLEIWPNWSLQSMMVLGQTLLPWKILTCEHRNLFKVWEHSDCVFVGQRWSNWPRWSRSQQLAPEGFQGKQLAVSLFGNTQVGKMRNTYEHQRVSDGKIQITILILRREPCLVLPPSVMLVFIFTPLFVVISPL